MRRTRSPFAPTLLALAFALPAGAQFATTQVSATAAAPFRLVKGKPWTFEDVSPTFPGTVYNIYRRVPGDGFRCIAQGLPTNSFAGDATQPPSSTAWWYTVNGTNASVENLHGNGIPIAQPCLCTGTPATTLALVQVATGLTSPIFLTAPPGDSSRLFVVERAGRIRIIKGGALLPTPFLDIRSQVSVSGEEGLLSMAFHPDYATNGLFYVDYSTPPANASMSTISEFRVSTTNPDLADPTSERVVLAVQQPNASNHKGGQIQFGPKDGYLYISFGDGGGGGDTFGNSQRLDVLLAKILRIDVNGTAPPLQYRIPPTNPFVASPPTRPEIWAWGLRNPFRFSFDRLTGDLYIGDVGQNCWEEIDVEPYPSRGGFNYGWNIMEGFNCFTGASCGAATCPTPTPCPCTASCATLTLPVLTYDQCSVGGGAAVIGGYVYRGCKIANFQGTYFYGDNSHSRVWSFVYAGGAATNQMDWTTAMPQVSGPVSFGEDADGEIYIVNGGGSVWHIVGM